MVEKLSAHDLKYLVIEDDATETAGGLFIPPTVSEGINHGYGTIDSAGYGSVSPVTGERIKLRLQAGERVCFIKHSQMVINKDGVDYYVLTDHEIIATLHQA